jgi:2-oxoglutarate dehydrogenase E1 component
LERDHIATLEDATEMVNLYRDALDRGECVVQEWRPMNMHSFTWTPYLNHEWDEVYPAQVDIKRLQELARRISEIPEGIEMQPRVAKIYSDRASMAAGDKPFDWGGAETLAYATLVDEGIPIRLSGEDTARGTFFHRHAVVHNQKNGSTYTPLAHVHNSQGRFRVWDSVLLCHRRAAYAGDLGSAVRRLRQRRSSGHRSVHQFRRTKMGPDVRLGHAVAARL